MGVQVSLVQQVQQVREVEVGAARGEGLLEARQVAERERLQLQDERQERLRQVQDQEQQVCAQTQHVMAWGCNG